MLAGANRTVTVQVPPAQADAGAGVAGDSERGRAVSVTRSLPVP
jgi:hypothetical protein